MRNEARYVERCLASIFAQDYPQEFLEILVLDGESTDGSREIVERMFRGRPNCRLLTNPGVIVSSGFNLGLRHATGEAVGIVSSHAELAPSYVSTAVETLNRTGADLVGGPMVAVGEGHMGRSVALATSTPFGVGNARFHYAKQETDVDTVYMGLCWRKTYDRIGTFDEEMVKNQDDELSYRLLGLGGRIVCNPAIRSVYYNRSSLRSLWTQYFQYGYWKVRLMQKHPKQMRWRHFIPALFAMGLSLSAALSPVLPVARIIFAALAGSYLCANLLASALAVRGGHGSLMPYLPATFLILHLAYGFGFLKGIAFFFFRGAKR